MCGLSPPGLTPAWATIIRRDPDLQKGDWVIYSNAETPGKAFVDQAYIGAARVLEVAVPDVLKYQSTGMLPPHQKNPLS